MANPAKTLEGIIKAICDRTTNDIDEDKLKALKGIVRRDERALRYAHEVLMKTLTRSRFAGTRERAVRAMDELFTRSVLFRQLTLEHIDAFLKYAVGVDNDVPLPDEPKGEAERLRQRAVDALNAWETKFKHAHKQLTIVRKFAMDKLGDEAPEAKAAKARRVAEEKELKKQQMLRDQWRATREDTQAMVVEIHSTLAAARECFKMLFDKSFVDEFDIMAKAGGGERPATGDDDEWEDVDDGAVREWPAVDDKNTTEDGTIALRETSENAPILEQLRGLYRSTKVRYIPRLAETLGILGRIQPDATDDSSGDALTQNERSTMVNIAGELKQSLHALVQRCEALRLIQESVKNSNIPNANALEHVLSAGQDDDDDKSEEDIESRRGASQRAINALLARSSKRRRRSAAERREAAKSASENDVNRRVRKMLASEIKAHNDDVLATMGQDVFEVERQRQNTASEALANDLIEEEIERHKQLTSRGKTPRDRIENSLKNMRNRR